MGLLRTGIVIAVGVALLPSDRESQDRLYERAGSAAHWTLTFCDRNALTCEKGKELWAVFVAKAEFGAKLAYDMIRERQLEQETHERLVAPASLKRPMERERSRATRGTLTDEDRMPAWRGTAGGKGGI